MWHPPSISNSDIISPENLNCNSEEERMVNLAIKRSLGQGKIHCQFCKQVAVSSKDDLILHQLHCKAIDGDDEIVETSQGSCSGEEENIS